MKTKGGRVLITGAGRGIGRALAFRFAAKGSAVVVTDLDEAAAQAVATEIRAGVDASMMGWSGRADEEPTGCDR